MMYRKFGSGIWYSGIEQGQELMGIAMVVENCMGVHMVASSVGWFEQFLTGGFGSCLGLNVLLFRAFRSTDGSN